MESLEKREKKMPGERCSDIGTETVIWTQIGHEESPVPMVGCCLIIL
jgi:hypothetical protein